MTGLTDKELFSSMSDRPVQSFEKLFRLFYQRLFLFACKFVDEDTAHDVVQDTFYSLWQNRQKVQTIQSPGGYLFAMVRNQCLFYLRKRRLAGSGTDLQLEELHFYESEESVLQFDLEDRINHLFDSLPPRSREVFLLSRKKGLSNKEIAERLNISLKSVEKHITISLKHFKDSLKNTVPAVFSFLCIFFSAER